MDDKLTDKEKREMDQMERDRQSAAYSRAYPGQTRCLVCGGEGCRFCDERIRSDESLPNWYKQAGRPLSEVDLVKAGKHPTGRDLLLAKGRTCYVCKWSRSVPTSPTTPSHELGCSRRLPDEDPLKVLRVLPDWKACVLFEWDLKLKELEGGGDEAW